MRFLRSSAALLTCLATACSLGGTSAPDDEALGDQSSAIIVPPVGPVLDGGVLDPGGPVLFDRAFTIRTLGRRCVDAGTMALAAPVTIRDCNARSASQRIRIRELDAATHDVELRAGSYCFGVKATGLPPLSTFAKGTGAVGFALVQVGDVIELQTCSGSAGQRFALDGDAIMVGGQGAGRRVDRRWVLEPQKSYTADGTPLAVASRELSDAEYFLFDSVDGTRSKPTTGFVVARTEAELDGRLTTAGWGTVIEVAPDKGTLEVRAKERTLLEGVTLRGNRLRREVGPEIHYVTPPDPKIGQTFLIVGGSDTRITGLRLTGSSLKTSQKQGNVKAIDAYFKHRTIIDRNELTAWTLAAVDVHGDDGSPYEEWGNCGAVYPRPRPADVRVVKNSIHENQMWGMGYGVVIGDGGFALVQGNVAYANRHTIAASGTPHDGYVAVDNFILARTPTWDSDESHGVQSDFDMHGSGYDVVTGKPIDPSGHEGGRGGDYVDIGWNTFLQRTGNNYYNRGLSCRTQDVHDNVVVQSAASDFTEKRDGAFGCQAGAGMFTGLASNAYGSKDPSPSTAVGDFDGDGVDDVFVGTGAGFYFSSGAVAEWRFLSRKSEKTSQLRFGDFDADGRTDVLAVHGAEVVVSWAGISDWQAINVTAGTIDDLAVGDFDGDRVSDLFYANGSDWYVARRGRNWAYFATSNQRTVNLRFGDFTHDGRTDVFAHAIGGWAIVDHAGGQWSLLGPARSTNMGELFVADFDGDGTADVGRFTNAGVYGGIAWAGLEVSTSGTGAFAYRGLFPITTSTTVAATGRFDAASGADLVWGVNHGWSIATGGTSTFVAASRQDMR